MEKTPTNVLHLASLGSYIEENMTMTMNFIFHASISTLNTRGARSIRMQVSVKHFDVIM